MNNYHLQLSRVSKNFGRRLVFSNIDFEFKRNGIIGISGGNGSGKSTLSKIISGVLTPSSGSVNHIFSGRKIAEESLHNHIGFVSPYLILYDEFSAMENLFYLTKIRGNEFDQKKAEAFLDQFNLLKRKDDIVKTYSSGMKQRLKFVFSLLHYPNLLILDEPTSNLDEEGKNTVYSTIKEKGNESIVIIASNETADLNLCEEIIHLKNYKNLNG